MNQATTGANDPIIVCQDVHKWYGQFHALRGISLEVNRGEVIVIFGPSGSGKSTFIRTLDEVQKSARKPQCLASWRFSPKGVRDVYGETVTLTSALLIKRLPLGLIRSARKRC